MSHEVGFGLEAHQTSHQGAVKRRAHTVVADMLCAAKSDGKRRLN